MTRLPTAPEDCLPSSEAPPELLPSGWTGPGAPPLEFDVGCHKGLFLVEMARLHPGRNFLGIERQGERVEKTQKKIRLLGLSNAAVVRADGLEALKSIPPDSVDCIHVLFPDPWPKRRHSSRRLVQAGFLDRCLAILKPGGLLRLVTDDQNYADAMRDVAAGCAAFSPEAEEGRDYPLTEFQKKFLAEGRPFYTLLLRRNA
jgi:tRNA (guanine-N7-)-methyltransferase